MNVINIKIFSPTEQRANVVADPLFKTLLAMTPAQLDAYLLANVTNFAQVRGALSILARGLVYLINKDRA